ncbi:glycosyl transferase [Striga asiatica]|uniref:Glycosyl transferase n=1 Tax=Striga asiatica TaxID=4170 RepID=A0A5A7NZX3_STRAF|nr:glycosyl transferase [Striga asiatica]
MQVGTHLLDLLSFSSHVKGTILKSTFNQLLPLTETAILYALGTGTVSEHFIINLMLVLFLFRPLHTLLCLNIFFKKDIIKTTISVHTCTKFLIFRLVTLILKHPPISITYRHTPITITYRNTPITYSNTSITYRNTPITYTPISCFLSI